MNAILNMILSSMSLTLKSVNMKSQLIVRRNTNRYTTAPTLLVMTLKLLESIIVATMEDTTSVKLRLVAMDTPLAPVVMTRRTKSATSTPRRTPARSPSSNVRRLLTLPILRSARRSLLLTVRKPMRRFTTAAMLSVTTPKLLLTDIMVVITRLHFVVREI